MARSLALMLVLGLPLDVAITSWQRADAAPVPFPKTSKPRSLTRDGFVGTWSVHWGTVPATFILSPNGDYVCIWPGAKYVGSWGMDRDGRLWITESNRPESPSSWQSYAIRLTPDLFSARSPYSLRGPVEIGATGISVRLLRQP
jgi:hypothetical protein